MTYAAYVIHWTEYESGWGQRPDGTSAHKTKAIAEKYAADFIARQRAQYGDKTPHTYSRPGDPILKEIELDQWVRVQSEESIWLKY